jgi:hypothetical protein
MRSPRRASVEASSRASATRPWTRSRKSEASAWRSNPPRRNGRYPVVVKSRSRYSQSPCLLPESFGHRAPSSRPSVSLQWHRRSIEPFMACPLLLVCHLVDGAAPGPSLRGSSALRVLRSGRSTSTSSTPHRPVRPGKTRPTDLTTQHRDLVTQHHQLGNHRGLTPRRAAATSRTTEPRSGRAAEQPCTGSCQPATNYQLTPSVTSFGTVQGNAPVDDAAVDIVDE